MQYGSRTGLVSRATLPLVELHLGNPRMPTEWLGAGWLGDRWYPPTGPSTATLATSAIAICKKNLKMANLLLHCFLTEMYNS